MRTLNIVFFAVALCCACSSDAPPSPTDVAVSSPDVSANDVASDSCNTQCEGKVCGDDGCGGSCGSCIGGTVCDPSGQCVDNCITNCVGKTCGNDGCGGSCGTCAEGTACGADGTCAAACTTDCAGKNCGDDGCGGSCGTCEAGETCDEITGTCQAEVVGNCGEITFEGCCLGTYVKYCDEGQLAGGDCGEKGCGWDAESGYYYCGGEGADPSGTHPIDCQGECTPLCDGRECGPDGCGGTCGTCDAGTVCNGFQKCAPEDVDPGACCEAQEGAGCGNETVEACVCAVDAFCCESHWDGTCALYVEAAGCAVCPEGCAPQCDGKLCGDDGCGGTCGDCGFGFWCDAEGQCHECIPACEGKACGPDTCGGLCGECDGGKACTDEGQCVEICTPACGNKTCGSDGCGDVCGTCDDGETCSDGNCVVAPSCPDDCGVFVPGAECQCDSFCFDLGDCCETVCESCGDVFEDQCCEPACDGLQCGDDGCGSTCGICGDGFICGDEQLCVEAPPCVPACEGKVCGDDGCGSLCGDCGDSETCDAAGACQTTAPPLSGTWVRTFNLKNPTDAFQSCQQVLNMSDVGAASPLCEGCDYAWAVLLLPVSSTCGDWAPESVEETFSIGLDVDTETPYFDFGEGWGKFSGTGDIDGSVYTGEFYTGYQFYADLNGNGDYDEGEELSIGYQFAISW